MKLLHLADLHLGKRLFDLSLLDDQRHILEQIIELIRVHKVDAVLIAGDIYDKPQPSAEAVALWDTFLAAMAQQAIHIFIIAGNHDSPARLHYGSSIFSKLRIHIASEIQYPPRTVTLEDEAGPVHFVLLPFFRLYELRRIIPETDELPSNYEDALRLLLSGLTLPADERRIVLAHQFFRPAAGTVLESESEQDIRGGLEAINSKILEDFTYAALGHLHRPQRLLNETVRYAGSPLAYSFSESMQNKTVPLVTLGGAGDPLSVTELTLKPLHPMLELKGDLNTLIRRQATMTDYEREAYYRITLTDRTRLLEPLKRLLALFPNVLQLRIERDERILVESQAMAENMPQKQDLPDLFAAFYEQQTGRLMEADERETVLGLWESFCKSEEEQGRQ